MSTNNPLEDMAAAIYSACYADLPDIHYRDRDWAKHRAMMDGMSMDEKREFYEREKTSGQVETHYIEKIRKHTPADVEVTAMFPQMWGSTALGFGGIGGAAMTSAYTIIIESKHTGHMAVYFGGRFAYMFPRNALSNFHLDMEKREMVSCKEATARYSPVEVTQL